MLRFYVRTPAAEAIGGDRSTEYLANWEIARGRLHQRVAPPQPARSSEREGVGGGVVGDSSACARFSCSNRLLNQLKSEHNVGYLQKTFLVEFMQYHTLTKLGAK